MRQTEVPFPDQKDHVDNTLAMIDRNAWLGNHDHGRLRMSLEDGIGVLRST